MTPESPYTGQMFIPDSQPPPSFSAHSAHQDGFDDEPPLLEELGINPDHIMQKTLTVLNPFRATDVSCDSSCLSVSVSTYFQASVAGDSDLAGPIVFAVAFGSFIMFSGKLYFNYIYGIGLLGCIAIYCLLNLMSGNWREVPRSFIGFIELLSSVSGVSLTCVVSVLGYCLLPIVALSGVSVLFSLSGLVGNILTAGAVGWCAISSSKLFITALEMKQQQVSREYSERRQESKYSFSVAGCLPLRPAVRSVRPHHNVLVTAPVNI